MNGFIKVKMRTQYNGLLQYPRLKQAAEKNTLKWESVRLQWCVLLRFFFLHSHWFSVQHEQCVYFLQWIVCHFLFFAILILYVQIMSLVLLWCAHFVFFFFFNILPFPSEHWLFSFVFKVRFRFSTCANLKSTRVKLARWI